jgi:integrase
VRPSEDVPVVFQKLSQRLVEDLKPEPKRYFVRDVEVRGLSIGINPTGRKSFYVYYRVGGGRGSVERRPVIGTYPAMTVQEARVKARDILACASRGEDPSADRAAERNAETLSEFTIQYLTNKLRSEIVVENRNGFKYWLSAIDDISAYHRNLLSIWNRYLGPMLGSLRLRDITPSRCLAYHSNISSHSPVHANRCVEVLRSILNQAIATEALKVSDNPCSVIKKNDEPPRRRYASRQELVRLGQSLTKYQETDYVVERAIRFLLFSGMRKMEALKLKWDQVDLDLGIARLNTKTGLQDKKLSVLAIEVLRSMPQPQTNPYVFPSSVKPQTHLVDIRKVWAKITKEAGIVDLTIHDLRRTYGTYGTELNGLWASSKMLGHRSQATTERNYAQHDNEAITKAEDATSKHIDALMSGHSAVVTKLSQQ